MEHRTAPIINLARSLIYLTVIILTTSVETTRATDCYNRLDIVFAVDTTSSQSSSSFDQVKSEVKAIVSGFTVGQHKTRLALISMSKQAKVLLNFNAVNSLSDFNAAVDSLAFSTDVVDLSEGLRVAKESVLNTARSVKISKIVILVKDRRSINGAVSSASVLTRMTSRAAEVKSMGAKINVVGTGGLWNRQELGALFGSDYILFLNKNTALSSVKSLNNKVCTPNCSKKVFKKAGLCYNSNKHVLEVNTEAISDSSGLVRCHKQIVRKFSTCSKNETCFSTNTKMSTCKAGKVTITSLWKMFNHKTQSCESQKDVQKVDCKDAMTCAGQVADVMFLLDFSGSVLDADFGGMKQAVITLINAMNIGRSNVRVGVIRFHDEVMYDIRLGSINSKSELVKAVGALPENTMFSTATDKALQKAHEILAYSRFKVAKFVFLLTDGKSNKGALTFRATSTIKNAGVTLYAIGIGSINRPELETMTAPETATNFIYLADFTRIGSWARNFSKQLCIKISDPDPRLCDSSVFLQSVSHCFHGKREVTTTKFKYDAARKCIKSTRSTVINTCSSYCVDPVDGNAYRFGETWTKLCHEFKCDNSLPLRPLRTKCPAADGTCKSAGSTSFKCRDEKGVVHNDCQCVDKGKNNVALLVPFEPV